MIPNSDSLVVHRGDCVSLPSWKYSIQTGDNILLSTGGDTGFPEEGLAIPSMRSHDSWAFDPPMHIQCSMHSENEAHK